MGAAITAAQALAAAATMKAATAVLVQTTGEAQKGIIALTIVKHIKRKAIVKNIAANIITHTKMGKNISVRNILNGRGRIYPPSAIGY